LNETLREEKAADKKLTRIAEADVNRRAAREWHQQEGMLERGAKWVGTAVGTVTRSVLPRSTAADPKKSRTRKRARRSGAR
jgi:hypothetical protein